MSKRKFGQSSSAASSSAAFRSSASSSEKGNVWRCDRKALPGMEKCLEIKRNALEKDEHYYLNASDCQVNCTVPNTVTREILNYLDVPDLGVVQKMYPENMRTSLKFDQTQRDLEFINLLMKPPHLESGIFFQEKFAKNILILRNFVKRDIGKPSGHDIFGFALSELSAVKALLHLVLISPAMGAELRSSLLYLVDSLFVADGIRQPWLTPGSQESQKIIWYQIGQQTLDYVENDRNLDAFMQYLLQLANTKYIELDWTVFDYADNVLNHFVTKLGGGTGKITSVMRYIIHAFRNNETVLLAMLRAIDRGSEQPVKVVAIPILLKHLSALLFETVEPKRPLYKQEDLAATTLWSANGKETDVKTYQFTKLDKILSKYNDHDAFQILSDLFSGFMNFWPLNEPRPTSCDRLNLYWTVLLKKLSS